MKQIGKCKDKNGNTSTLFEHNDKFYRMNPPRSNPKFSKSKIMTESKAKAFVKEKFGTTEMEADTGDVIAFYSMRPKHVATFIRSKNKRNRGELVYNDLKQNPPRHNPPDMLIVPRDEAHLAEIEKELKEKGIEIKEEEYKLNFFGGIISGIIGQMMMPIILIVGGVVAYKIYSGQQAKKETKALEEKQAKAAEEKAKREAELQEKKMQQELKIAQIAAKQNPACNVRVDTSQYVNTYGKKPRGKGNWAFDFGNPLEKTYFAPSNITFTKAKELAIKEADKRGSAVIKVLP